MARLYDSRSVGDRSPFAITVDLGESIDLTNTTKKFWLKTLDLATIKVSGSAATATDVSEDEGGASAPALSIWRLEYTPITGDVDTKGDYVGEFEVVFAGADPRFYPPGGEFIQVELRER